MKKLRLLPILSKIIRSLHKTLSQATAIGNHKGSDYTRHRRSTGNKCLSASAFRYINKSLFWSQVSRWTAVKRYTVNPKRLSGSLKSITAMLFPIVLVLLVGFGKTTYSFTDNRELHHNVSVSSDRVQQDEETGQNFLGPEINKNQQRDGKSIATNIITQAIIALLAREQHNITKSSNFPTLVATNISEQCHKDSVIYHQAYLLRVDWAKKSH